MAPVVSSNTASRISPSSGFVSWINLTLSQTRGFLTNYTITLYKSTSNVSCGNTVAEHTFYTSKTSLLAENLDIQSPYCVTVSGSTVVGEGPISNKTLIPSEL